MKAPRLKSGGFLFIWKTEVESAGTQNRTCSFSSSKTATHKHLGFFNFYKTKRVKLTAFNWIVIAVHFFNELNSQGNKNR
jgi:hypothetical protein